VLLLVHAQEEDGSTGLSKAAKRSPDGNRWWRRPAPPGDRYTSSGITLKGAYPERINFTVHHKPPEGSNQSDDTGHF
jgi:hypothetical protein